MQIDIREKGDIVVFAPVGRLMGGAECEELKSTVTAWADRGTRKVIFDFHKLEWANSTGIGAVISSYLTIRRLGGVLKFAHPTEKVTFYFRISKLDTVFEIYDTVNDALHSFEN